MSWIHEQDFNRVVERAIDDNSFSGIYNVSSAFPVSQKEFMKQLRKAMRIPIGLPATELMVRLGAHYFLRTDPELALYGRYVIPKRLVDEGFEFRFPELKDALGDLCKR